MPVRDLPVLRDLPVRDLPLSEICRCAALNGLLRGTGSITIAGLRLTDATLPAIRQRVGFVFQDPDDQLFCPSVADDVAFGPRQARLPEPEVQVRVTEALAAVGAGDLARRHPHHLSLGQKKRVAIATALACRPEILVLDEPSANLDPRSRRELIAMLAGLACTLVLPRSGDHTDLFQD